MRTSAQADDIAEFGFIDPPSSERITCAIETLRELGALDEEKQLTDMGRMMAEFPLGPQVPCFGFSNMKYCFMIYTAFQSFD